MAIFVAEANNQIKLNRFDDYEYRLKQNHKLNFGTFFFTPGFDH